MSTTPSPLNLPHAASAEAVQMPFVALTVRSTGIHPSTGRIVAIDAVTFSESGAVGEDYHVVIDPESDPGPRHMHGLSHEEVAEGEVFARVLKALDRLLDGRTLVVHDTAFTWGFIVAEARRAMVAAARQNRSRNRGRSGSRRRTKVGHVPVPERIIDTLETSRRQGVRSNDVRLGAVAQRSGLDAPSPVASVERALSSESAVTREETRLLIELYRAQAAAGPLSAYAPDEIRADRFGLQRSHLRVDAAEAPRAHTNPGKYQPGKNLIRGMEIVVAPEITEDPDTIIAALMREELNYSEKLTRETSAVVCNVSTDLVGKPMHAHRKGIPLIADAAFLAALERVEEAQEPDPKQEEKRTPHVPNSNNRRSSGRNQRRRHKHKSTSNNPQGGGNSSAGNKGAPTSTSSDAASPGGNSGTGSASSSGSPADTSTGGGAHAGAQAAHRPAGDNASPNKGRRRRRRGGRGGRGGGRGRNGKGNSGGTAASNND